VSTPEPEPIELNTGEHTQPSGGKEASAMPTFVINEVQKCTKVFVYHVDGTTPEDAYERLEQMIQDEAIEPVAVEHEPYDRLELLYDSIEELAGDADAPTVPAGGAGEVDWGEPAS